MCRSLRSAMRVFSAAAVILFFATTLYAAPRDKGQPIVKMIKKAIKSLGDGLTIPKP